MLTVTNRPVVLGSMPPIKICITGFSGEVADVLNFDLYVTGFINVPRDQAQFIITGSNGDNVQGRVTNPLNQTILNKAYSGATVRKQAHAFADDIVQAINGGKPIAQTRIALKVGSGMRSEIYLADFDGHNAQPATADKTTVTAPSWSASKRVLYYSSYLYARPQIFSQDLASGERKAIAHYGGANISPAVSPDGSKVAMILSKDGWVELYVCDADGGNPLRLTKDREDESSPCWSPDGKWICYATKASGGQRILCKIPATGGTAQRISTSGVSNPSEPDWSPDGKWIAFTAQMGSFEICVIPAEGGVATVLVEGTDPSWSPNSRTLIFAQRGDAARLSLLDVLTKQVKDVPRISSGNNSQPSWAR